MALPLVRVSSIILALVISSDAGEYYWRSFNGTIPDDALIGSKNFGYDQYIGRGPVDGLGLFIGPIIPGTNSIIMAAPDGFHTIYNYLEILCSEKPFNFTWFLTNSTDIQSLPHLITGGYYFTGLGKFYIGRISMNAQEFAIGYVNVAYNNTLYYDDLSVVTIATTYEVLTSYP